MTLAAPVGQTDGVSNPHSNGYVRFERGPKIMFRRVMIQDTSGNLLESFENYNDLHYLHELLTGTFHSEGLVVQAADMPGVNVNMGAAIQAVPTQSNATNNQVLTALQNTDPFF